MNRDNELDMDMEKGCTDPIPEGPTNPAMHNRNTGKSFPLWKIAAAVLMVGLAVFAVAFPVTRARDDDSNDGASSNVETPSTSQTRAYTSSNGAFNVTLGLFHKDIVNGYSDTETLEEDLSNAAKFLLNNVVQRNTQEKDYGSVPNNGAGNPDIAEAAPAADGASDTSKSSLNDFGQNNQEDDVEEGDMMVSNGAIGKSIVREI